MPFVGASPPSTLWILEHTLTHGHKYGTVCTQWCTQTHYHMQTNARLHTSSLIYTHVPPPPCDSSNTRTHTHTKAHAVYPYHPWVMNNICLSVPPSLPLAWLLACFWLFCHNVILSAFLSPITKMCSDNQFFFFFFYTDPFTYITLDQWFQHAQWPDKMI